MGPLSWLFRAVRTAISIGSALGRRSAAQQIPQTRILNPQERQQEEDKLTAEAKQYTGWRDIDSSWIQSLNYNPLIPYAQMLVARTQVVYVFGGMTLDTYKAWLNFWSKGTFFNRYLYKRYTRSWNVPVVHPTEMFSFASGTGGFPVNRK